MPVNVSSIPDGSLTEAFTKEHQDTDVAIENYMASACEDPGQRVTMLLEAVSALRRHIYLGEEFVFPHQPHVVLMMPVLVMHREHGELRRRMDALEESLQSGNADQQLQADCQALLSLLENHNFKEEPVLYPLMDTAFRVQERQKIAIC